MIYESEGLENDFKPIPQPKKIIPKENICKCGHLLSEHIINDKNKKACYHVMNMIKNVSDEEQLPNFCECTSYNPKIK